MSVPTIQLLDCGLTCNVFAGNGERFAARFRESWRAVPPRHRGLILRSWQRSGLPPVELMNGWSGWQPTTEGSVGGLRGRGVIYIRFHAPYIDLMSDSHVRFIVGHELVHVLQWAEDRIHHKRREVEREAETLPLRWLRLSRCPRRTPALKKYQFDQEVARLRAWREREVARFQADLDSNPQHMAIVRQWAEEHADLINASRTNKS